MKIYQAEWITWNDGEMSDFNLPQSLGYFQTELGAEERIKRHQSFRVEVNEDDGFTTRNDYRINQFELHQ